MKIAIICLVVVNCGLGLAIWYVRQPNPPLPFGCDKTYINAKGEDTGECQ